MAMALAEGMAASSAPASAQTGKWRVRHRAPWLTLDLGRPMAVLGWPVVGPADGIARHLAWLQVTNAELPAHRDPAAYFRARAAGDGIEAEIGLLTAADLGRHAEIADGPARAVVTLGLGNAESVIPDAARGPARPWHAGTINIVAALDAALSQAARLEALSIVTEARTAAVLAHGRTLADGRAATGTGTDCIVLATATDGRREIYAGLHTECGRALGAAVYGAVEAALRA
jgi:adenosylcobinamide amidohydrolase